MNTKRDIISKRTQKRVYLREIKGDELKYISQSSLNNFINVVYENFIELSRYPNLKHTPDELFRLLTSPNLIMYTLTFNKKLIGYITGEMMNLDDGRNVLFISYLYVVSKYRRHHLGTSLLNKIIKYAEFKSMDAIVLVCNTEDDRILNFYMEKGFMYDLYLRRYDKYDVLTLNLN
jgi:ribosomal protein S18 acetylase RimI-like enzyme